MSHYDRTIRIHLELVASDRYDVQQIINQLLHGSIDLHSITAPTNPYYAAVPVEEGEVEIEEEELLTLQTLREHLDQRLDDVDQALRILVDP